MEAGQLQNPQRRPADGIVARPHTYVRPDGGSESHQV